MTRRAGISKGRSTIGPRLRPVEPDRSGWLRTTKMPTAAAMTKMGTITHSHHQCGDARWSDTLEIERDEMRAVPKDWSTDAEGPRARFRPRLRDGGPRAHPSLGRSTERRLGSLDYVLLALIALGIAITIAMAVIDPSG